MSLLSSETRSEPTSRAATATRTVAVGTIASFAGATIRTPACAAETPTGKPEPHRGEGANPERRATDASKAADLVPGGPARRRGLSIPGRAEIGQTPQWQEAGPGRRQARPSPAAPRET
jgi:hypothetical protein